MTPENSDQILKMMKYISERVGGNCIRFQAAEEVHHGDYVLITAGGGGDCPSTSCCSELGRTGNRPQFLNLDPACMQNSTVVHELVHTLGTETRNVMWFGSVTTPRSRLVIVVFINFE